MTYMRKRQLFVKTAIRKIGVMVGGFLAGVVGGYQLSWYQQYTTPFTTRLPPDHVAVAFSPKKGCTPLVVYYLQQAKKHIYIAIYSLTAKAIADALIAAHKRGVKVYLLADRSQSKGKNSQLQQLQAAGIPVRIARKVKTMHNKVAIIDSKYLLTGSFNYTENAEERNVENCLALHNPALSERFYKQWQEHWERAAPFKD